MPELPEVEITRRRIAPLLVGRQITRVSTTRNSYLYLTRPAVLRRGLEGRRVTELARRGKYLVARLDDAKRLLIHLGMTGQLFADTATSVRLLSATARQALAPGEQVEFVPDAHTHLQIAFDDSGPRVFLRDVRKFGKLRLLGPDEPETRLDRLGVDALRASGELLFAAARGRNVAVKSMLLDQSVLAGVGNIYADESLFLAGVRPTRRTRRVTRSEFERIAQALRAVLQRSIETGGSSIRDFVAPDGSDGRYQDERKVYGRSGEPCLVCGTAVKRVLVGQRGTHYCRRCQP